MVAAGPGGLVAAWQLGHLGCLVVAGIPARCFRLWFRSCSLHAFLRRYKAYVEK